VKIIFFGLGSIGLRHAKILLENYKHDLLAYRSKQELNPNKLGIKEVYSWNEIEAEKPDIAFITNPTHLHVETALACAKQGMHLFIEKPLSHTLENISELEKICNKNGLTAYVAYCLRFHPVIKKMHELLSDKVSYHVRVVCSSYLPAWRENQKNKQSYSQFGNRGGGVIWDLSHEFDYIDYLFGGIRTINGVYGKLSNVTVDAEDFADIIIQTNSDIKINLHLNFLSLKNERTIHVDFHDGYLTGDLLGNQVIYYYKQSQETLKFSVKRDDYFSEQLDYFFENLQNPEIMNNVLEAKQLLEKIVTFKEQRQGYVSHE